MAADRKLLAAAFAAIAFLTAGPARGAVTRPTQTAPAAGAVVQFLPSFAWTPVAGADKYEFQISADAGMNSPVLGSGKDDFFTRNTRATLLKTIPNGTYYWRVRATNAAGGISNWTEPRSFRKLWNFQPALQNPSSGDSLTFPTSPVVLTWSGVPGAAHYLVSAASDPSLGSLVLKYGNQDDPKGPPNVAATSAAITSSLAPGSYYWSVTPVDAEGNRGVSTPVASFNWLWPSATATQLEDLNPAPEAYDPRFSWNPIPGAARYEVEVNSSSDFTPGSKVCCDGATIATSISPTEVLKDNVFYWRVRALDPDGNAGVWNYGGSFTKTFDKVAPAGPVTGTSIKNVRMRDNLVDPGTDVDTGTAGYQTRVPVVRWDPVPGAASYEVEVVPWTGAICDWGIPNPYIKKTAVPQWTPLSSTSSNPVTWQGALAEDALQIVPGEWCVRVRARADRAPGNQEVWGDYTYLSNGSTDTSEEVGEAFEWTAYPDPTDVSASAGCVSGIRVYPCARRLQAAADRHDDRPNAPLHVERSRRDEQLLRRRRQGRELQQHRRRGIHADSRLCTAELAQADDVQRRDDALLLGGPAGERVADGNDAPPLSVASAAKGSFQKQSTPPGPGLAERGAGLPRPADFPLDADARRAALPAPGRGRPDLRQPTRRRRHRRDLLLERHDLPGRHRALLARPRGR